MNKYILLNPGPVNLHHLVREAAVKIDLCHRQKEFIDILMSAKGKLKKIYNRNDCNVSILHGSGSLAVESGLSTFVTGNVLVINNGHYCERIYKSLKNNPNVTYIHNDSYPFGAYPDIERILELLKKRQYDWITVVHHETSTGILNPLKDICDMASAFKVKVFVDAVSSFGGHDVDNRADVVCSNSNKCLESIPGAAIVIWSKFLNPSKNVIPYLDANLYVADSMPCTLNTNAVMALDVALDLFLKEDRYERYRLLAKCIREEGSKYFDLFLKDNYSNILTSFCVKDNEYDKLCNAAMENGFVIYPGKKSSQFRISNLGVSLTNDKIKQLFSVLGSV
jgi:2-aminoethylphosphonate-pyruvate transaminase